MEPSNIAAVIYDPVVEGQDHASFNYSLAASAATAFKPIPVAFYAGPSHIDYLARTTDIFREHNVIPVKIENAPRRAPDLQRFVWDLPNLLRVMRSAHKAQCHCLVLSCANTSELFAVAFVRLLSRVGGFCVPTSVVLHSILYDLWGWRSRNPLRRGLDTTSALALLSHSNVRFWVLESGIAQEFIARMPRIARQVGVFPHPIRDDECVKEATPLSLPVRFGFLGRAMRAKGFDVFLEIASAVRKAVGERAEFHAIGEQVEAFAPELLASLSTRPSPAPLDRQTYLSLVRKMHYVMLLNSRIYRYVASGAALDAVAALRPLIALDEPGNSDLLRNDGDVGFVCRDATEMIRLLIAITTEPQPAHYAAQVNNLVALRTSRLAPPRLWEGYASKSANVTTMAPSGS